MTHEKYTKLKFQCLSINFFGDTAILNLINLFFSFFPSVAVSTLQTQNGVVVTEMA